MRQQVHITIKLKSCPFCGSEAEIISTVTEEKCYGIRCKGCDILVGTTARGVTDFFRTPLAAADVWNRRVE